MFRNLCLYEIEVEFTYTIIERDQDGDYVGETKRPGTRKTLRLIADRFYGDHKQKESKHGVMLEAWIASEFRFQKEQDFRILSVTNHNDISFLLEY